MKMKKRGFIRNTALILAALSALSFVSCKDSGQNEDAAIGNTLSVAIVGEPISEAFAKEPNPINASNPTEYSVGTMTTSTLMRYEEGKGWQDDIGHITVSEENGNTVAKVRILDGKKYYSGNSMTVDQYVSLLQKIVSSSYNGWLSDFYKNPIPGLVAYRFGYIGLTLEDIPDFDAQTDAAFKDLTKEGYKQLLIETNIAGWYTGNPRSEFADGRTFMKIVQDEGKIKHEDSYFNDSKNSDAILAELADIFAEKPENEWFAEAIRPIKRAMLYEEFVAATKEKARNEKKRPNGISGVSYDKKECTVRFEGIVAEDEVISMLNLPIVSANSNIGAGMSTASGYAVGRNGCSVGFTDKNKKSYTLYAINEEEALPALRLGQAAAVKFEKEPDKETKEKCEELGMKLITVGKSTVAYNPKVTDEETLRSLPVFYN